MKEETKGAGTMTEEGNVHTQSATQPGQPAPKPGEPVPTPTPQPKPQGK